MSQIHRLLILAIAFAVATGCETTETLKATPDEPAANVSAYDRSGYVTKMEDGRLWVFVAGSEALSDFEANGELAKHTTLVNAGPGKITVKAPDRLTIDGYLASKPGFTARVIDDRLWVFKANSEELATIDRGGELAKHTTKMHNDGGKIVTIKGPDIETISAYLAMK